MKAEPSLEDVLNDLYENNVALLHGVTERLGDHAQRYVAPAVGTAALALMTGYLTAATIGVAGTPQEELRQVFEAYAQFKGVAVNQVTLGDVVKSVVEGEFSSLAITAPGVVVLASASAGLMLLAQKTFRAVDSLLDRISEPYHNAKVEKLANLYSILKDEYRSYRNLEETTYFTRTMNVPDPKVMLKSVLLEHEGSLKNYDEVIARGESNYHRPKA